MNKAKKVVVGFLALVTMVIAMLGVSMQPAAAASTCSMWKSGVRSVSASCNGQSYVVVTALCRNNFTKGEFGVSRAARYSVATATCPWYANLKVGYFTSDGVLQWYKTFF